MMSLVSNAGQFTFAAGTNADSNHLVQDNNNNE